MGLALTTVDRDALIGRYGVVGHPPPADLMALAELAAVISGTPIAEVNLMGGSTRHLVAGYGREPETGDRADSMCSVILDESNQVMVSDTRNDPRFADNPFVTGERASFRFYAAAHVRDTQGTPLGTLCVFDYQPRSLDARQSRGLGLLGRQVEDALELRRRTSALIDTVAQLADARAELTRSNEALRGFASQVSHDLRNPLTAVVGFLEELQDLFPDGTDPADYVARALNATHRMYELSNDVLGFAKLGSELRREPVALRTLVEKVQQDLASALTAVSAAVEIGPLPTVRVDPAQIQAVLRNLVSNAVTNRHPARPPLIAVHSARHEHAWVIEVVDNGIGVPAAKRAAAFAPLTRVHDPHAAAEGSGIGLASARRIVHAHGGQIGLDASPTGGTVAWFTLPDQAGHTDQSSDSRR